MTDREERQHVIEVLQNMVDWMEAANYIVATPERRHALLYAIASIKTDLKYDLLYEEISGQADKPTAKNDKVDCKHTDCKNCVNHKYCDYESNCSEIPTGSTAKNDLVVAKNTTSEKTEWIPVSERLPKDGQSVLFCDIDDDIMVGYHVKGRPETHFSQDGTYEDMKNVRAWQPLPKPYSEVEQ